MERFQGNFCRRTFGRAFLMLFAVTMLAAPSLAASPVLLTVIGRDGAITRLTEADLDRLEQRRLDTSTFWTTGVQHFEGVFLRDVLAAAGIDPTLPGGRIEAMAHNDYAVAMPLSDFVKWDVLLARRMNGANLTLRDKGPFWIVYPRDRDPALKDMNYNHRWVWQLRQLKLL